MDGGESILNLFTKQSSFIKYRYDAIQENIEGFDLIRFFNENTVIRIAATYTEKEVPKINSNYMLRTIELIDRRVGYPNWIELFMDDIEKYNMKQIDNSEADNIIREANASFLKVLIKC